MRVRLIAPVLATLVAGSIGLTATSAVAAPSTPAAVSAAQPSGSLTEAVTGTVNGVAQSGTLTVTNFVQQAGQLLAVGNLTLGGTNLGQVQVPVDLAQSTGTCQILDLVLGPLDLNLLGLVVHLDTVHLNITAQQGPGNLLGNLLCAVAGLLDNNGPLAGLTGLLNNLLRQL